MVSGRGTGSGAAGDGRGEVAAVVVAAAASAGGASCTFCTLEGDLSRAPGGCACRLLLDKTLRTVPDDVGGLLGVGRGLANVEGVR